MIKIENTDVHGFEAAIRGMRNPFNSWDKSDTTFSVEGSAKHDTFSKWRIVANIGENDLKLMKQLVSAGSDHSKFMRMITVTCDITAPMYWWKEMDTYKVGTVRNSCSTMHKICSKELTLDDFSHEHLGTIAKTMLENTVVFLNYCIDEYKKGVLGALNEITGLECASQKDVWWQIIQLLPSSYNQRSTVQINYAVLRNMYHARITHKLDEWYDFCQWVESLPCSELITYSKEGAINNG